MQAAEAAAAASGGAGAGQQEAYEIDQWILDFAQLFRESLNIEPDRHLDLTNLGWDRLQVCGALLCGSSIAFLCLEL
jgi:hypothetical protein